MAGHLVRRALVVSSNATLVACATSPRTPCADAQTESVQEILYFGRDRPGGQVGTEDWSQFLSDTVTPRFPAGFSTWQASGQWRSASGALVQEPSYVLSLVHPENAATDRAAQEIVAIYKSRFEQEAVLRVRSHACMSL
jgi:hypothetical protein